MKKLQFVIFILFLSSLWSCTKVFDESEIKLLVDDNNINIRMGNKLLLPYTASSKYTDSVCIYVDSEIYKTHVNPEEYFVFEAVLGNMHEIHLALHHHSGLVSLSKSIFVDVHNHSQNEPSFDCSLKNINGEDTYYVGDQLLLTLSSKSSWFKMSDVKNVDIKINNIFIGSLNSSPYTTETPIIVDSILNIEFDILTKENIVYNYKETKNLQTNSPPVIDVHFLGWSYNVTEFFIKNQSISINVNGFDDYRVKSIDLYINDKYVYTRNNNDDDFDFEISIDTLSFGLHTINFVAFDETLDSTISKTINAQVLKRIQLDHEIIDSECTEIEGLVYLISTQEIIKVNPIIQEITETIDLPFPNPTSSFYTETNHRLYISFEGGELIYWDENLQEFITIDTSSFTEINKIEIDSEINKVILLSDGNVFAMDLTSLEIIGCNSESQYLRTLGYSNITKTIICGGPVSYNGLIYKFQLYNDHISLIDDAEIKKYVLQIQLDPTGTKMLIRSNLYDITSFGSLIGRYKCNNVGYSYDKTLVYGNYDENNSFKINNAENFTNLYWYKFPILDDDKIEYIYPTRDNAHTLLIVKKKWGETRYLYFFKFPF